MVFINCDYRFDNKHKPNKAVDFVRLESLIGTGSKEINFALSQMIDSDNAVVTTDFWTGMNKVSKVANLHIPINTNVVIKNDVIAEHLPWVHKIISNFKRNVLNTTYYGMKSLDDTYYMSQTVKMRRYLLRNHLNCS